MCGFVALCCMCDVGVCVHIITWQGEIFHVYWYLLRLCVCVCVCLCVYLCIIKKCVRICPLASVASFGDIVIIFS